MCLAVVLGSGSVLALSVATAPSANAARIANVTDTGTGYTQVFSQPNAEDITGTWSFTGTTLQAQTNGVPSTSTLPVRGTTSTTFTPALPDNTVVAQLETGRAGCVAGTAPVYCDGAGTITIRFSKPVTNPVFHVAGLGGNANGSNFSAYGTLTSVPAGATLGAPSAGSTSLEVVNGNRFRTSVNQPGTACSPAPAAGCGSMVINGTNLTEITFAMGMKASSGPALVATSPDQYNAFITLQDQPVPAATRDVNTTKRNTAVTTSVLANDVPATGRPLDPTTVTLFATGTTPTANVKTLTIPNQGTYTVITTGAATGQITFTPLPAFLGTATPINYRVSDSDGSTATSTLTISVPAGPPGPVADAPTTSQGIPVTFDPTVNDTSADSPIVKTSVSLLNPATLQYGTTVTMTGEGTYTVSAAGDVTFTPEAAFVGTARAVTYRVANQAGVTATSTITPTVTPGVTITVRKNLTGRTAAGDQFTLSLRGGPTVLSATTSGTATGIQAAQISRTLVQPGSTYTISETQTSGAGLGYSNAYECTRAGTVIASGSGAAGTITVPSEAGADVICTFTNTPQTARLFCDTNHFYSITTAGALQQGDIITGGPPAAVGTWTDVARANALAIGSGGNVAYAIDQSTDATDVASILKWSPEGGFVKLPSTSYPTVAGGTEVPGAIVAGAFDQASGRYFFGKFANSRFYIWSFTETNQTASRFAFVGSFSTGTTPNGNGDMAFDASGNLSVVGAATVNSASSATVYTLTAETLAAGSLVVSASTVRPLTETDGAFVDFKGVAFSPRGTVYLADATSAYEFDATTWRRVSGTPRITIDSIDLATCSSPSTITVQKNVVGRQDARDQFTLTASAQSQQAFATATTSGTDTGRQAAQIGPYPVPIGTTVTINEAMTAGSASPVTAYTTIYECYSDGVRLSRGTTASGTVTMPNRLSANVNCTYFNSPAPVSSVQITKTIQEFSGLPRPGAGWTVGTTATAGTTGTATALPSQALTQPALTQQTNAEGKASWTVLYGSTTARATIVVSEVQQTGFAFVSGSCRVNGALQSVTFTQTSTQSGVTVSASLTGTPAGTGIAPGSVIECEFVNRPTASLTLVKQVAFGSAQPTDWTLSATGPSGALPGPSGRSGTAAASGIAVTPGAAYRLDETGGPLTYVQTGTWECRTATNAVVSVTAAGEVTPTSGTATTCTATNSTASITLLKQVQNPRTGFQAPDWRVTATPTPATVAGGVLPTESRLGAEYVASGNPANTFFVRPGHSYTLSETVTDPTRPLAYQELRLEQLTGSTWTPVPSRTISAPTAGQTAVYRFVNAPVEPTRLPLTGGTSADAFYIGGGLLFVLALALLVWHRRQRRRGALR